MHWIFFSIFFFIQPAFVSAVGKQGLLQKLDSPTHSSMAVVHNDRNSRCPVDSNRLAVSLSS